MAITQRKLRRGTAAQMASFTGAQHEITYESDTGRLVFHDGSTAGGAFKHPTIADIQKSTLDYATAGGTADVLTLDFGAGLRPAAYTTGLRFKWKAASANTGSATINVTGSAGTGLGAKTLKKAGGADNLSANDMVSGGIYEGIYDGTNVQVLNIGGSSELVHIQTVTQANAASLAFTSGINSTYEHYIVEIEYAYAAAAGDLFLEASTDGGSTWTAFNAGNILYYDASGPTTTAESSGDQCTKRTSAGGAGSGSLDSTIATAVAGHLDLKLPSNSSAKSVCHFVFWGHRTTPVYSTGVKSRNAAGDVDAIRIRSKSEGGSDQNLWAKASLYGRKTH